ncbi:DHHA1 domain-containing protein [Haloglomus litoreum]|uniref:DHHA1 domain-containing protein n=1 Tax=Haloglomus litoreum TaxID=3034026 RepID=UPI0023E8B688|nr:DHHA1 domain-containing protein [Haloglomus sp. DT116]
MAAHSLAPDQPAVTSFDATVAASDEPDHPTVVLSETYFYPEGGGQPADRGTIAGVPVTDVQSVDGRVLHHLADPLPADEGEVVACEVDPAFRTYCRRAHTASHALYGAGRRLFDDLGYGGFGITAPDIDDGTAGGGKVRVDLRTPAGVDDDDLVELERLTNRAVWDARPVSWERVPADEALDREDVAFNTKTEEGITGDTVRLVEIDGWDVAACGGTHVGNTHEIGPVTVLERSNPGEGLTRVEFAVGPRAIDRRAEDHRAALGAARALGTAVSNLPDAVGRLQEERSDLESELSALRERYVDARVAALREDIVERDGGRWLVGTIEGVDANALADRAGALAGETAAVVALVTDDASLAVATDGTVDAGDVVDDVAARFGGGGGGSPTVAQAGGLDADPEAVVAFLRGE